METQTHEEIYETQKSIQVPAFIFLMILKDLISSLNNNLQLVLDKSSNPESKTNIREVYFDILAQQILVGFDEDYLL